MHMYNSRSILYYMYVYMYTSFCTCHEGDGSHGLLDGHLCDGGDVEVGVVRHYDTAEQHAHDTCVCVRACVRACVRVCVRVRRKVKEDKFSTRASLGLPHTPDSLSPSAKK